MLSAVQVAGLEDFEQKVEAATTEAFCLYGRTTSGSRYLGLLYEQCLSGVHTTILSIATSNTTAASTAAGRARRSEPASTVVVIELYMEEDVAAQPAPVARERIAAAFDGAPPAALTALFGLQFVSMESKPSVAVSSTATPGSDAGALTAAAPSAARTTATVEATSAPSGSQESGIASTALAIISVCVVLVVFLIVVALVVYLRSAPAASGDGREKGGAGQPEATYVRNHFGSDMNDIARLYSDHATINSGWDQTTYAITAAADAGDSGRKSPPAASLYSMGQPSETRKPSMLLAPVEWQTVEHAVGSAAKLNTARDATSPAFSTSSVDQDIDHEWDVLINSMDQTGWSANGTARTNGPTDSALGYMSTFPVDGYLSTEPSTGGYLSTYPSAVPGDTDAQLMTLLNMRDMCDDVVDGSDANTEEMRQKKADIDRQLEDLRHIINPSYLSLGGAMTPTGHFYPQQSTMDDHDAAAGYLHFPTDHVNSARAQSPAPAPAASRPFTPAARSFTPAFAQPAHFVPQDTSWSTAPTVQKG